MRTAYANASHVSGNREEIVLRFGASRAEDSPSAGSRIEWTDAVCLSPAVAKRFALLLGRVLGQYEERFGPLGPETASAGPSSVPIQASPEALRSHPRAGRLIALVEALGVAPLFERSCKVTEGSVSTNRFLLGLPKREIEPESQEKILNVCRQLGGSKLHREAMAEELPDSDFIHFGFEEDGGRCLYKLYLEFSTRLERMAESDPEGLRSMMQGPAPFLMFLGYKWNPEDARDRALTKYHWYPGISYEGMLDRAAGVVEGRRDSVPYQALKGLLQSVAERLESDRINYFEVFEEASRRRSFDVNVYDAGLRGEDLRLLLLEVGRGFSLPVETSRWLEERLGCEVFGHLSGGVDREGRGFLTFYHGGGRLGPQASWGETVAGGTA